VSELIDYTWFGGVEERPPGTDLSPESQRTLEEGTEAQPPADGADNLTLSTQAPSKNHEEVSASSADTVLTPPRLAWEPDILARFAEDLHRAGVAGEEKLAKLEYLAMTSRVLPWGKSTERPVSVIAKGTSSTGKSHATRSTLQFFPGSAWLDLGSMSRRYLFYSEENFKHRFLYIPEYASIRDDEELVALVRVLLSEGRIVHGTVEMDRTARLITKEGPTGLLMTTTEAAVDPEMETRCLTIVTDDTPGQTRRVFRVLAGLEDEEKSPVDFKDWHQLQQWIADSGAKRVSIPFVDALAQLMPTTATRLRRDFVSLLCLVRAHAILHQKSRERDGRERIVATLADYTAVRELVSELVAEGADASAPIAIRETVEVVAELVHGREHVGVREVTDRLKIGRTATYGRVKRALLAGYLVNVAPKGERGLKIALGAALPGDDSFLPTAEQLEELVSAVSYAPYDSESALGTQPRDHSVTSSVASARDRPPDEAEAAWVCPKCCKEQPRPAPISGVTYCRCGGQEVL
jgi:hypothetical protein